MATIAVDDPAAVGVGSVLAERVDAPLTVRAFELVATADSLRLTAWTGADIRQSAIADRLRRLVERVSDAKIFGKWRYRVVSMSSERVNLQAVRKSAGLPDATACGMWPGVAGAHAELALGAEVLVEFIEGDREQPIVTGFAGRDGVGHVPESLSFCDGTRPAAAAGDVVQVFFPPTAPISGLISGSTPFVGTITLTSPGIGTIQPGQNKVRLP